MGRSPCCDKVGLKKGPWTVDEDQKLLAYIEGHGHGSWRALPEKAGLQRCGKSCRLRWTNYLRPDIKRGKFSLQEEQTIIQLHALLGNRWSAIATHLPKRTDNEIKNYWNTHLKKRLARMGIDPVTHKPRKEATLFTDGKSKNAAEISHMAQWESARLEAEARLVRESKLRSLAYQPQITTAPTNVSGSLSSSWGIHQPPRPQNLDHSPTSTLTFSDNPPPIMSSADNGMQDSDLIIKRECFETHDTYVPDNLALPMYVNIQNMPSEPFADITVSDSGKQKRNAEFGRGFGDDGIGFYEDIKSYWSSILNLVNSCASDLTGIGEIGIT